MTRLFLGSSICEISKSGDLSLSHGFCVAVTSRKANDQLYVGLHEYMNCLVIYDEVVLRERVEQLERSRPVEGGATPSAQLGGLRRSFGLAAPSQLDGKGRVSISPWLHERAGEAHRALVIGMGHSIEVWDLDHVLAYGDRDPRNLAVRHLEIIDAKSAKGDQHALSLQPVRSQARQGHAGESGFPVHTLHAL